MPTPYSTPFLAPLYPEPPYHYPNAELYSLSYAIAPDRLEALLPAGLRAPDLPDGEEHVALLGLARYPDSTIGAYRELFWLLPAVRETQQGFYCPFIYVTSDAALCAGRELWGWPKKLAEIEWTDLGENRRQIVCERGGGQLLSVRVEITESYAVQEAVPQQFTVFNVRHIPGAPSAPALTHLTATDLTQQPRTRAIGLASVRMRGSQGDPVALLAPPDPRVAAMYVQADMTLPPVAAIHPMPC